MPPAGRLRDRSLCPNDSHGCNSCSHAVIGPSISGSTNVYINNRPSLRLRDSGIHSSCCGSNTWEAIEGSQTVFINNLPAHRQGDKTQHCGGLGQLVEGSLNVFIENNQNDHGQNIYTPKNKIKIKLIDFLSSFNLKNIQVDFIIDNQLVSKFTNEQGEIILENIDSAKIEKIHTPKTLIRKNSK